MYRSTRFVDYSFCIVSLWFCVAGYAIPGTVNDIFHSDDDNDDDDDNCCGCGSSVWQFG